MAPQDYISRSNSKKKNPYNKQQPPSGTSLKVKVVALITCFALVAAGYGLWQLKSVKPVVQTAPETTTNTPRSSENTLPKPPTEKWEYIDTLKEDKELDVGQYEVVNKGPYKMQCGSFRTRAQAESMKAKIAFSGLVAQISSSNGSNGLWYKVALGPYPRKRLAEKDKHKLKRNNITTCQIWLWK